MERRGGEDRVREIRDRELGPLLEEEFGLRLGEDVLQGLLARLNETSQDSEGKQVREPGA